MKPYSEITESEVKEACKKLKKLQLTLNDSQYIEYIVNPFIGALREKYGINTEQFNKLAQIVHKIAFSPAKVELIDQGFENVGCLDSYYSFKFALNGKKIDLEADILDESDLLEVTETIDYNEETKETYISIQCDSIYYSSYKELKKDKPYLSRFLPNDFVQEIV